MKKYLSMILIVAFAIPWILGAYSEYPQDQWYAVRTAVAAASVDSDLSATQKTWAYWSANLQEKTYRVPTAAKTVVFQIIGKDNDTTGTVVIYAYHQNGPAEAVCSYTSLSGLQQTSDSTAQFYADTLTQVYDRWPKTVWTADADGGDGVGKICLNTCGAKYFVVLITAIKSSDTLTVKATYWQ